MNRVDEYKGENYQLRAVDFGTPLPDWSSQGATAVSDSEVWPGSEWGRLIARARAFAAVIPTVLEFKQGDAFINLCARDAFISCAFQHDAKGSTSVNISLSEPEIEGNLSWEEIREETCQEEAESRLSCTTITLNTKDSYMVVEPGTRLEGDGVACIQQRANSWVISDAFQSDALVAEVRGGNAAKVFCQPPAGISMSQMLDKGMDKEGASAALRSALGVGGASGEWCYAAKAIQSMGNGKACIVMTEGSLWGGQSSEARRNAVERGLVEAVVLLPKAMFPEDDLRRALVVFSPGNEAVRFSDLSEIGFPGVDFATYDDIAVGNYLRDSIAEILARPFSLFKRELGIEPEFATVSAADVEKAGSTFDPRPFCDDERHAFRKTRSLKSLGKARRGTSKAKLRELEKSPLKVEPDRELVEVPGGHWSMMYGGHGQTYGYSTAMFLSLKDFESGAVFGDVAPYGLSPLWGVGLTDKPRYYCMTDEEMLNGAYGVVTGTHLIVSRIATADANNSVKVALYVGAKFSPNMLKFGVERATHDGLIVADSLLCLDLSDADIDPVFVLAYFRSDAGQLALQRKMKGRKLKQISSRDLGDLSVPYPSVEAQKEISARYIQCWKDREEAWAKYASASAALRDILFP